MERSLISHAWRGLWRLPVCGPHPGWPLIWFMAAVFLGLAARHALGDPAVQPLAVAGSLLLIIFIPMIIGAVSRSRFEDDFEARQKAYLGAHKRAPADPSGSARTA